MVFFLPMKCLKWSANKCKISDAHLQPKKGQQNLETKNRLPNFFPEFFQQQKTLLLVWWQFEVCCVIFSDPEPPRCWKNWHPTWHLRHSFFFWGGSSPVFKKNILERVTEIAMIWQTIHTNFATTPLMTIQTDHCMWLKFSKASYSPSSWAPSKGSACLSLFSVLASLLSFFAHQLVWCWISLR